MSCKRTLPDLIEHSILFTAAFHHVVSCVEFCCDIFYLFTTVMITHTSARYHTCKLVLSFVYTTIVGYYKTEILHLKPTRIPVFSFCLNIPVSCSEMLFLYLRAMYHSYSAFQTFFLDGNNICAVV